MIIIIIVIIIDEEFAWLAPTGKDDYETSILQANILNEVQPSFQSIIKN